MRSSNRFNALSNDSETSKMAFRGGFSSSDEDGWTRVGAQKKAPHTNSRNYASAHGGAGHHGARGGAGGASVEHTRSSIEQETKRRLYAVNNQMKSIFQTSSGDLSIIGSKAMDYYRTLTKSEEKAKVIGVLVENSLHELFCPGTFFGDIISSEMSITSSLSGLKERDGYNLFTWAVWIPWNKEPIAGLSRNEDDIISSVSALMAHRVNPFKINQKHESIFDTAALCADKKKFSGETYDAIYQMLLYNPLDIDLYMSSLKHNFPDILNPEMKFSKGYLQWCLSVNDELCSAVIKEAFETDKIRLGETKVSFQTTEFQYVTAFDALMQLVRTAPHKNFEQFFHDHPIDVDGLTSKIASYYLSNILELHHTAYQLLDVAKEGWSFKNVENLGAFVWDLSRYIEIAPADFSKFSTKIKVGYGVRGLKKTGANADLLRELLAGDLSPVERSFVTRSMESASMSLVAPKPSALAPVKEEELTLIEGFKTGLEKVAPEEAVSFSTVSGGYHTPGCVHDSICDIAEMGKKHDHEVIGRSFVHAACGLYKAHHLANLGGLISYLISNNLLNKDAVKKVIDEESEDILDANDYSKSSKEALKILVTSL